ncbi:MAG: transrane protein [Betaproteobacteria bacterium]|nr:transrane protein [Betaproteobacteria bacterium]
MKRLGGSHNGRLASAGWQGAVGVGLLVFAGAFYFSAIRSERSQLADMQRELVLQRQQVNSAGIEKKKAPADKITAFYAFFPSPATLPDVLEKIFGIAEAQSLQLEQGDYRVVKDTAGKLTRFQITFPVKGTYPQIRKFVAGALSGVPALALNGIQFERKKVGDTTVEARIRFVVFLGRRA